MDTMLQLMHSSVNSSAHCGTAGIRCKWIHTHKTAKAFMIHGENISVEMKNKLLILSVHSMLWKDLYTLHACI